MAEERMVAVDRDGRELWRMPAQHRGIVAEVEIGREDLNNVLATASGADTRYGEHLVRTTVTNEGIQAETSLGDLISTDLLVVAEGTRSRQRTRSFPAVESRYLGGYLAFAAMPYPHEFNDEMRVLSGGSGVMVAIRPGRLHGHALIAISTPRRPELTTDSAAQRQFITDYIERAGIALD